MALLGRASLSSATVPSALAGSGNGGHVLCGLELGYAAASMAGERLPDLNEDGRLHGDPSAKPWGLVGVTV
jgi:hypothetical protein